MAASQAFLTLRDRILELAQLNPGDCLLDIGSGTGLLALAAAPHVQRVIALDASLAMCSRLADKFTRLGIANGEVVHGDATSLPITGSSVDVVLSNYCFHHLDDDGKRRALYEVRRVLRPGGRLVFADMMFRFRPFTRRDRKVITLIVARMIRHGWGGVLRLGKNTVRVLTRRGEHPASAAWWHGALLDAGFAHVAVTVLEHEGGVACARAPDSLSVWTGSGRGQLAEYPFAKCESAAIPTQDRHRGYRAVSRQRAVRASRSAVMPTPAP